MVQVTSVVSIITVSLGQLVNAYLISKWRILTRGKYFWLRSLDSSVMGDSVTVILTTIGAFMGRIPSKLFAANLVPELIIMVSFTAVGAIPAMFIARITAKSEELNNYDIGVNFNPFKFSENNNENWKI